MATKLLPLQLNGMLASRIPRNLLYERCHLRRCEKDFVAIVSPFLKYRLDPISLTNSARDSLAYPHVKACKL